MKEVKNSQLKKVSGGAAGYGNLEYHCACGKKYLKPEGLLKHIAESGHKKDVKVYYQQNSGKLNTGKGNLFMKTDVTVKSTKLATGKTKKTWTLKYPNGKTDTYTKTV